MGMTKARKTPSYHLYTEACPGNNFSIILNDSTPVYLDRITYEIWNISSQTSFQKYDEEFSGLDKSSPVYLKTSEIHALHLWSTFFKGLAIHWCAKIKDEVEKLVYQLNEKAERTERPIRRISKGMYGSTCADMQVDVMVECLSCIKHVVGTTSGCFYPRSNHWEKLEEGRSVTSVAAEFGIAHSIVSRLWRKFQTTGTAIRGFSSGPPRGTTPTDDGTLSYRPEETGGRQREKSLDTRHSRLDDRYHVLPWPEDCTVVVCLHDALYGVYL
ncbi:uncharacterized protein TNCV_1718391 [Trichonephila clavipes]|nr:uncharacterized protein TNCV_1718391 [Trichonephila clavipes]